MDLTRLAISAGYDGHVSQAGSVSDAATTMELRTFVGTLRRCFVRVPLTSLDAQGIVVASAALRLNISGNLGGSFFVGAYNGDGQADPQPDAGATKYSRCLSGVPYAHPNTPQGVTGVQYVPLGGTFVSDLIAAKLAVGRFAFGLYLDPALSGSYITTLETIENAGALEPALIISYYQSHLPGESGRHRQRGVITNSLGVTQQQVLA